jgi:predicted MPP superfamily phosphohydrolase
VKKRRFNRRRFLIAAILGAPLLAAADAKWIEPGWVKTRRVRLGHGPVRHRFVHFTDIHHKGDRAYLESVVNRINRLSPEFVCFTGDLIEEGKYLDEALQILARIKAPLYGVPGNHDYWAKIPFDGIARCFAATGGAWLVDHGAVTGDGHFSILGAACRSIGQAPLAVNANTRNILLFHYPSWVKKLGTERFDLMLAGHSHGGQVRVPFYGALMLPFGVDEYDLGLFHTRAGPLYVNPGIGWFPVPIRLNCRPEVTVFEVGAR